MRTLSAAVMCIWAFATFAWPRTPDGVASSTGDQQASQLTVQKQGKNQKVTGIGSDCTPTKRLPPFKMDATGNVSAKGRSIEGPVCIEVGFPPLQTRVTINSVETRTAGPDPSSVLLGGSKAGGVGPTAIPASEKTLSKEFAQLADTYYKGPNPLVGRVEREPTDYNTALTAQTGAIADIKALLNSLIGLSLEEQATRVANTYKATIGPDIQNASEGITNFLPTDQPPKTGSTGSLSQQLHSLSDNLDRLGYDYPVGDPIPDKTAINCTGDTVVNGTILKVG